MNEKEKIIDEIIGELTPKQVEAIVSDVREILTPDPNDLRFKLKYSRLPKEERDRYFGTAEVPVIKGTIPGPNRNFHKNNKAC